MANTGYDGHLNGKWIEIIFTRRWNYYKQTEKRVTYANKFDQTKSASLLKQESTNDHSTRQVPSVVIIYIEKVDYSSL